MDNPVFDNYWWYWPGSGRFYIQGWIVALTCSHHWHHGNDVVTVLLMHIIMIMLTLNADGDAYSMMMTTMITPLLLSLFFVIMTLYCPAPHSHYSHHYQPILLFLVIIVAVQWGPQLCQHVLHVEGSFGAALHLVHQSSKESLKHGPCIPRGSWALQCIDHRAFHGIPIFSLCDSLWQRFDTWALHFPSRFPWLTIFVFHIMPLLTCIVAPCCLPSRIPTSSALCPDCPRRSVLVCLAA